MLGELRFKSNDFESETSSTLSNQSINNAYGDTSLRSIPLKLPMWTIAVDGLPNHLCIYSFDKSTFIFSCTTNGTISLVKYSSPVTYDSPSYNRSFNLFPQDKHIIVRSFTVFNRFMLLHVHKKHNNGSLYFFTYDGNLEHKPIELSHLIYQYIADDNYLWAIDSVTHTIFFHRQPLSKNEISSVLSKCDNFITFDDRSNFSPLRITFNQQLLAVLGIDLQQVYIYNKISRERIFTSHFSAGINTSIRNIGLFPHDGSLLLKFDSALNGKHSLFIHFDAKNQSVGRIEGKYCLDAVIGPNNEILVGFNLRTGIIRCYT